MKTEKFGLAPEVIAGIHMVLSKYSDVSEAIVYGSRAKGNYRPSSDIDLVLVGKKLSLTAQLQIETEIDDLLLPYKLDLSIYHMIENPELLEHIQTVGQIFYRRS